MEVLNKIQKVLTSPDKFFEGIKKEPIGPSVKYFAVTLLVPVVIMLIVMYTVASMFTSIFGWMFAMGGAQGAIPFMGLITGVAAGFAVVAVIVIYIVAIIMSFIGAAVMHLFVYLCGGRNGYANTYKTMAYGGTPSILLGWIPFVGIIASIWGLVLEVKGLKALHGMTTGRAVLAILLPVIIIGALAGFLVAAGMMASLAA